MLIRPNLVHFFDALPNLFLQGSGRYGPYNLLSVRNFPFSEGTPGIENVEARTIFLTLSMTGMQQKRSFRTRLIQHHATLVDASHTLPPVDVLVLFRRR